jgi:hypothetical protein
VGRPFFSFPPTVRNATKSRNAVRQATRARPSVGDTTWHGQIISSQQKKQNTQIVSFASVHCAI